MFPWAIFGRDLASGFDRDESISGAELLRQATRVDEMKGLIVLCPNRKVVD